MGRHTTGSVTPSSGGPEDRFGACASAGDANSASAKVKLLTPTCCNMADPALSTAEADRSVARDGDGPFMMLWHDFREPGRPFCNDRRSNCDRSRGAVSRSLADSSPRLAHSTAHSKTAGGASCHSPRRISWRRAKDVAERCASSSPVGLAWVVVGQHPLLAALVVVQHLCGKFSR